MAQTNSLIFFDIFILNTYSLWRQNFIEKNPDKKRLPRNFHRNFQLNLAKKFLKKSSKPVEISVEREPDLLEPPKKRAKKVDYCHICPYRTSRSTVTCRICNRHTCKKHLDFICQNCVEK